jgi:hypothetical protein
MIFSYWSRFIILLMFVSFLNAIQLIPHRLEAWVRPGVTFNQRVRVINSRVVSSNISLYWSDFLVNEHGQMRSGLWENDWASFDDSKFLLGPGKYRDVYLVFKIPDFVGEKRLQLNIKENIGGMIGFAQNLPIYFMNSDAEPVNLRFVSSNIRLEHDVLLSSVTLENLGSYHVRPKVFYLHDAGGEDLLMHFDLPVYPGKKRTLIASKKMDHGEVGFSKTYMLRITYRDRGADYSFVVNGGPAH